MRRGAHLLPSTTLIRLTRIDKEHFYNNKNNNNNILLLIVIILSYNRACTKTLNTDSEVQSKPETPLKQQQQ